MCEPISLSVMAAGYGLKAFTDMQNASLDAAADYQNEQAKANALLAKYQSEDAARRGELEIEEINRQTSQITGAGRTALAAGNIALGSGTPMTWEMDVAAQGARDIEMSRYNTAMEQWGYGIQGQNYRSQGRYAKWSAKEQGRANYIGNATSLLGTMGGAALGFLKR
jgi:ribosomal protein S13